MLEVALQSHKNHFSLNKFETSADPDYQDIIAILYDTLHRNPSASNASYIISRHVSGRHSPPVSITTPLDTMMQRSQEVRILAMLPDSAKADRIGSIRERRIMEDKIRSSAYGTQDLIRTYDSYATRVSDVYKQIDQYKPHILHYMGHEGVTTLCFENDYGQKTHVDKRALSELLGSKPSLKLVILSACYSAY